MTTPSNPTPPASQPPEQIGEAAKPKETDYDNARALLIAVGFHKEDLRSGRFNFEKAACAFASATASLTRQLAEKDRELGSVHGKVGILANKVLGLSDNAPTDDLLNAIEACVRANRQRMARYDKAHERFSVNLVELLQRCQNGDATCIYTAQIIEAEREKLVAERDALQAQVVELRGAALGILGQHAMNVLNDAQLETLVEKASAPEYREAASLVISCRKALAKTSDQFADKVTLSRAQVDSLKADKARLDWLLCYPGSIAMMNSAAFRLGLGSVENWKNDARAAIDSVLSAMADAGKEGS